MGEAVEPPLYSCRKCRNPVALHTYLISTNFQAKSGRAFMFEHLMNIIVGANEDRKFLTGYYTIAPIFCSKCGEEMGWTYVRAFDPRETYKEGKYVVEMVKILNGY